MLDRFQPTSIVVIGGEGFLGYNLLVALLDTYPDAQVCSLDLVQRQFDSGGYSHSSTQSNTEPPSLRHRFIQVDLTSLDSLINAFQQTRPQLVFHTASPWTGSSPQVCEAVNVQGTLNTIAACRKLAVQRLVYTSSAGVVFNGKPLINVDERLPVPKIGCDHYNITKAKAEAIVLAANGQDSLLTCAIRPAGIFGPGDRQAIPGMIQALKNGQSGIQLGRNSNLSDWTYVDNVVHAHILAAEKLHLNVKLEAFHTSSNSCVWKTNERRRLVTSASKTDDDGGEGAGTDDGELVGLSSASEDSEPLRTHDPTGWLIGREAALDAPLPVRRHRWDQWSPTSVAVNYPSGTVPVAGEAFFVTGGEPLFFWDVPRTVWRTYADKSPLARKLGLKPAKTSLVIPTFLAVVLALLAEFWAKVRGKPAVFKRQAVRYICVARYHNIEKARVVLGYEPVVGVEEGIRRSIEWFVANESKSE